MIDYGELLTKIGYKNVPENELKAFLYLLLQVEQKHSLERRYQAELSYLCELGETSLETRDIEKFLITLDRFYSIEAKESLSKKEKTRTLYTHIFKEMSFSIEENRVYYVFARSFALLLHCAMLGDFVEIRKSVPYENGFSSVVLTTGKEE